MLFANFGPTRVKKVGPIRRVSNFRCFCYIIYCAPSVFDILLVFVKKLFVMAFLCCANAAFKNAVIRSQIGKHMCVHPYSGWSGSEMLRVMSLFS